MRSSIDASTDTRGEAWGKVHIVMSTIEDIEILSSFVDRSILSLNEDSDGWRLLVRDVTIADWNKFGAAVRDQRLRLKLSQHGLATRAGVSRSWLAKLEAGHRGAEFEQILRLLQALELTLVLRSDANPQRRDEASSIAASPSPDTKAMQELMERHQRSAETRRRAWSAPVDESIGRDRG